MPTKTLMGKGMLLAVLVMALISLICVSGVQAAEPQNGGTLKIAALGLDTADPHRHTGGIAVQQAYVEPLTSIATDGSVIPFLAESYEISPDGLTYNFKIRQGVKFHNGREMNARDVLANFARVKENVTKGWLASAMKQVEGFEAPADYTFVDVSVQAKVLNLLLDIQRARTLALLFIGHDLSVINHVPDHILVIHRGKVVESGPAPEIISAPRNDYTKTLISSALNLGKQNCPAQMSEAV